MNRDLFFSYLWNQYIQVTPQAQSIQTLFNARGEDVINDHVAFRTFNIDGFNLEAVIPVLKSLGYEIFDSYQFPDKHLKAHAFLVPDDQAAPKIFFSEIECEKLSTESQRVIEKITANLSGALTLDQLVGSYPFQKPTQSDYLQLAAESEYAAWLSTMGYQANHFTVNINVLKTLPTMEAVVELLQNNGYSMNSVGGIIKGTETDYLVQSSTLADTIEFEFADGICDRIPSCFYEFAKRFSTADGKLFQGFVTNNANAIFDSTNRQ